MRHLRAAAGVVLLVAVCMTSYAQRGIDSEAEEFDFANGLFSRGMYDMAVSEYTSFLKTYPKSRYADLASYRISESHFLAKEYDEAFHGFSAFAEKKKTGLLATKAVLRKGQIHYFKEKYFRARDILTPLSEKKDMPEVSAEAGYYLAMIDKKTGQTEKAVKRLEGIAADSQGGEYRTYALMTLGDIFQEEGKHHQAASVYSRAGQSAGGGAIKIEAALRAGDAYSAAGEEEKAVLSYRKAMEPAGGAKVSGSAAVGYLTALYKQGEYGRLIGRADEMAARVKDKAAEGRIYLLVGNSFFQTDRYEDAVGAYRKAYASSPDSSIGRKAMLNECWALARAGRDEECLTRINEYLAKHEEKSGEAEHLKAVALDHMGRTDEAAAIYRILAKSPEAGEFKKEALYELGWINERAEKPEEAAKYYKMFASEYPDDERTPKMLLKAAQESIKAGNADEAKKDYELFLEKFPTDPIAKNALFQLGSILLEEGDYDGAVKVFKDFSEEYPASPAASAAKYWVGYAHLKQEDWDKAIGQFSSIATGDISSDEYAGKAAESMAFAYFQKADPEKAAIIYYRLIREEGYTALREGIYTWCAEYYLDRGQARKAMDILESLIKDFPEKETDAETEYLFGKAYLMGGDGKKAVEYLDKAVASGIKPPYLERAYLELGKAYEKAGHHQKAIEALERALEGESDNRTAMLVRFELAEVRRGMLQFDEAARLYMMVAILYEDEQVCPEALYRAAESFKKAGMNESSQEALEELKQRYPRSPWIKK